MKPRIATKINKNLKKEKKAVNRLTHKVSQLKVSKRHFSQKTNQKSRSRRIKPTSRNVGLMNKVRTQAMTTYTRSLLCPEFVRHAKIPSTLPLPTVSYHLKKTFKVNCNANGDLALLINPWYLVDTSTARSWILYNNDATLNVTTGAGSSAWSNFTMGSNITTGTASAYRLVSASIQIYPEVSLTLASGKLAGGILTAAGFPDGYTAPSTGILNPGFAFNQMSLIDNLLYYQSVNLAGQQGVRCIYLPFDPTFDMFIGLNSGRAALNQQAIDNFLWNFYVTSASANMPMMVEIYYNFELEPQPVSVLQSLADCSVNFESDENAIKTVAGNPGLVSQGNSNLNQLARTLDDALIQGKGNHHSFMETFGDIADFISDHSSSLSSAFKLGTSAILGSVF